MDKLPALFPGVLVSALVAGAAALLQVVETRFFSQPYIEALVLAILLGVWIRGGWTPGPRFAEGIDFSAKFLLEVAVVLLGASVSAQAVAALGWALLIGIALIVLTAIITSYAICRVLRLPKRMAILVACGNSICGNSAIAAVAPVIGADADEVASSIAFTAVLGVVVVLLLPLLVPLLGMSLTQYGALAGLTVYAVPQVLAATLPIGALSNQVGTVVKLVRVLLLGPVVLGLALTAGRFRDRLTQSEGRSTGGRNLRLGQLVPWFIVGFVLLAGMRTFSLIPEKLLPLIAWTATVLTTIAMAALGLGVDVRIVAKSGLRLSVAVTGSLVVLCVISLVLIWLIGMP